MKFNIPASALFLLQELNKCGHEAYIVGGSVRDTLLGITPHDYDICTSATPDEIIKTFQHKKIIPTGLKHGTVTIAINDEQYEVTTYRIDGKYSDGRRPDKVEFTTNLVDDLKRRDFTINAMAYSPTTGVVDPFRGQEDLKNKIIRCVGNPNDRFNEDGLRILRAVRFGAQLGFTIEEETSKSIHENKHLLNRISKERINCELVKILSSSYCGNQILRQYSDVICQFIPEINDMIGFEQNNPYHQYDIWEHTLHCMNYLNYYLNYSSTDDDIIVRLAVLLHDVGKPKCYVVDENNIGHFYGHADMSSKIAYKILTELKFSNEVIENVIQLIAYHDVQFTATKPAVKRLLNKLGEKQLRRLFLLRKCDITGQNIDFLFKRLSYVCNMQLILNEIIQEKECFKLKDLGVNGKDLMKHGVPQGKIIGKILDILLTMVIDGEVKNNKTDLLQMTNVLLKDNNIIRRID